MKKLALTLIINGLLLILPKYAFADSETFNVVNNSTIESIVIDSYDDGPGWYHCPYGGVMDHGPLHKGDICIIPPLSTIKVEFNSNNSYINQFVTLNGKLPNSVTLPSSITKAVNTGRLHAYCETETGEMNGGYCWSGSSDKSYTFRVTSTAPSESFVDTKTSSSGIKTNFTYSSSTCPSLSDANQMLTNYAPSSCPNTKNSTTFSDSSGRPWSIRCSDNTVQSVTIFKNATISVVPNTGASHTGIIECNYTNSNFSTTFTNTNGSVILPTSSMTGWPKQIPGADAVSGASNCIPSTQTGVSQCQWVYATQPY